jgi:hypothetical protein
MVEAGWILRSRNLFFSLKNANCLPELLNVLSPILVEKRGFIDNGNYASQTSCQLIGYNKPLLTSWSL